MVLALLLEERKNNAMTATFQDVNTVTIYLRSHLQATG
jgi:hypothetical protein